MDRMMTRRLSALLCAAAVAGCSRNKPASEPIQPAATADSASAMYSAAPTASPAPGIVEATRQEIQTRRTELITAALPMSQEQGQKFWPVYRQYRSEVQGLNDKTVGFLTFYAKRDGVLNDTEAESLIDQYLDNEKNRVELQQDWVKKFGEVLRPTQVAQLYQLENKMDAIVAYEIAGSVPLIERK